MSEPKRIQEYKHDDLRVSFNPNICQHSAVCIRQLPGVFNLQGRPWVNLKGDSAEAVMALIDKCPSGALSYVRAGDEARTPTFSAAEVQVMPNGPLRLSGQVRVLDAEGKVILEADKCSLCRCGASANKPFCDGSHRKAGFIG